MVEQLQQFWKNEEGQDLIEYTLLLALLSLGAAGLLRNAGTSVSTIWTSGDATLHNAALAAS